MRMTQLLTNVKLEPQPEVEDDTLFGLTTTETFSDGIRAGDIDVEDPIMDTEFFSSQMSYLDFDLLSDLNLPSELMFEDQLLEDSNSNSGGSQTSTSELGYLDPSSSRDSPPLSPPSPSASDYGSGSSGSFASCPRLPILNLYTERTNNGRLNSSSSNGTSSSSLIGGTTSAQVQKSILIATEGPNGTSKIVNVTIPKSSRGRSASHDSPDIQAMKRHIRMIRNRESACLSRKKKKDYVQSLEAKIKELEIENLQLKEENNLLKARLDESGITVNTIRFTALHTGTPNSCSTNNPRSRKSPPIIRTVAKVALLSLCCFMFVCFRSPATQSDNVTSLRNSNETPPSKSMLNPGILISHDTTYNLPESELNSPSAELNLLRSRRSLRLWGDTPQQLHSDNSTGDKIPRLQKSIDKQDSNHNGNTHEFPDVPAQSVNETPFTRPELSSYMNLTFTTVNKCPLHFNQTEAMRVQNDLKGIFSKKVNKRKPRARKPIVYSLIDLELKLGNDENKGLTVYDEKMRKYSGVLDKLQRREDTFYVVSLAVDNQLLLSAKAHNESSRPKMSFLMPWKNDTLDGKEELMQIDCEVTRVFNVNAKNTKKHNY